MLVDQLEDDTRRAMKENEVEMRDTLRMALAALQNRQIEKRAKLVKGGTTGDLEELSRLTDEEAMGVIQSEARRRKDAMEQFARGGRNDLAEKEERELGILGRYLPKEASDEEIAQVVTEIIHAAGSVSQKDFGRIMAGAMKRLKGTASGDRVSAAVKRMLPDA